VTSPRSAAKLKKQAPVKRNAVGETPLHQAAKRGDAARVQQLLRQGADPNVTDHAGQNHCWGSGSASFWLPGSASASNKNPDPNQFADVKPKCMKYAALRLFFLKDPDPYQLKIRIRIRIRVISRIRIRIKMVRIHNTGQNSPNPCVFFFNSQCCGSGDPHGFASLLEGEPCY
jgi:hypothetical protein